MRKLILLSICLLSVSQLAQAALFDDKEARQWIQELQQKTEAQSQMIDGLKKSQQALEERTVVLESALNGQGLMDLLNQVDSLNQELSQLKGQLEVAEHNLELTQQRQKDLYSDTDGRLRKLEETATSAQASQQVSQSAEPASEVANAEPDAESEEAKAFAFAQNLLKESKYKEAFDAFNKFIQNFSSSKELPNAEYSLGYTQFLLKNYKAAIATQQKLIAQFADSAKVPDAKFNIANCQIQLSDINAAKKTLRDLIEQHPDSELIPNAKRRLTILESIKK